MDEKTKNEQPQEQQNEFAGIEAELEGLDNASEEAQGGQGETPEGGAGNGAGPDEPLNNAEHIAGAFGMIATMAGPIYPSLKQVYTPETCQQLGAAVAAVANKHGWNMLAMFQKYAEEITLAFTLIPVMQQTYMAIDHDMKAKQAEQEKREQPEKEPAGGEDERGE